MFLLEMCYGSFRGTPLTLWCWYLFVMMGVVLTPLLLFPVVSSSGGVGPCVFCS